MDNPRRCPGQAMMRRCWPITITNGVPSMMTALFSSLRSRALCRAELATILHKREGYRIAFDGLEPAPVARYDRHVSPTC